MNLLKRLYRRLPFNHLDTIDFIAMADITVFINYRRKDRFETVRKLYEHLLGRFRASQVFWDVDGSSIQPGMDFQRTIGLRIAECEVVLAVIGPQWLSLLQERQRDPKKDDFVVLEIEEALRQQKSLVPILVGGANMPQSAELPDAIRGLAYRDAFVILDDGLSASASELADYLFRRFGPLPLADKIQRFRDEYLVSDGRAVPFGGRAAELATLDAWLNDESAPARLLLSGPAGRGKSALLVHWLERLRTRIEPSGHPWRVEFIPISIRFGTSTPEECYRAIAERLARAAESDLKTSVIRPAEFYRDEVRALLTKLRMGEIVRGMGAPLDRLMEDDHLLARLVELTECEPLLVRYYVQDLWALDVSGPAGISLQDLESLKPGFGAYFARSLEVQYKAWAAAGESIDQRTIDMVLLALSVAQGPLRAGDLVAVTGRFPEPPFALSVDNALRLLTRFVIGNGTSKSGYVLSHSKIGDHLREEKFSASTEAAHEAYVGWGRAQVRAVNSDPACAAQVSQYLVFYHRRHLEAVAAPLPDFMALVENGWRLAWAHMERGQAGFSSDVDSAWERAGKGSVRNAGLQLRCALTLDSIHTEVSQLPGPLVACAVRHGVVSIPQAEDLAKRLQGPFARAQLLSALLSHPTIDLARRDSILARALASARDVQDLTQRSLLLAALILHLPAPERPVMLREILDSAPLLNGEEVSRIIVALAPNFGDGVPAEVLRLALSIDRSGERADALIALVPLLNEPQKSEFIGALPSMVDSGKAVELGRSFRQPGSRSTGNCTGVGFHEAGWGEATRRAGSPRSLPARHALRTGGRRGASDRRTRLPSGGVCSAAAWYV